MNTSQLDAKFNVGIDNFLLHLNIFCEDTEAK